MSARRVVGVALGGAALVVGVQVTEPFAEEAVVVPPAPAVVAAQARSIGAVAEAQRDLLTAEDARLLTLVGGLRPDAAPYVQSVDEVQTLVLTPRGLGYELSDLVRRGAVVEQPDGGLLLEQNVLVAPGASLEVTAPGATLRLRSDRSGITSLVAWKADLALSGAEGEPLTLISWDPDRERPDTSPADGRAYVRTVSGDMDLTDVQATSLGFWAGRTGGVAFTGGSSGPAGGTLTRSTFRYGHYGVFASATEGLQVADTRFVANAVDGLSLHRRSVATTVETSIAAGNGRHGVSAGRGSEGVALTDVSATGNAEHGITLDGSPLSDGPSAGGASLRGYGGYSVTGGELRDNGEAGARIVDADDVTVVGTSLVGNRDGIVLVGTVAPTIVAGTTIRGGHRFGVTATGGAATIAGNRVIGADTPIRVRDASAEVTGNLLERATNHGISVVGGSVATSVVDNTLTGRGPSGLDLHRLAPGVQVERRGNDLDGWVRDQDDWTYWKTFLPNHPMLVLWVVILGIPLTLGVRARLDPRPVGTAPYRDDRTRARPAPLRADPRRPLSPGGPA